MLNFLKHLFRAAGEATREITPVPLAPKPEIVQEKPVRKYQERIVAGLGSGDSSDISTYRKFDALPKEEQDAIRRRSQLPRMVERQRVMLPDIQQPNADGTVSVTSPLADRPEDIPATAIADAMDHAYVRDPETHKLVLKNNVTQPCPKCGEPLNAQTGGCNWCPL